MDSLARLPDHLQPDPGRREHSCPVSLTSHWEQVEMTIPELQSAIIESKNKSQAIEALLQFCARFGINSNAPPEWWDKRQKLTQAASQK